QLFVVVEACLSDDAPKLDGLFVAGFLPSEPLARLVLKRRAPLGLFMELHVESVERHQIGRVLGFAPSLDADDLLAELSSPIAEMVDADRLVPQRLVKPVQCSADDRGSEMPDMERLRDVRRGIVDADRSPGSFFRAPVVLIDGLP